MVLKHNIRRLRVRYISHLSSHARPFSPSRQSHHVAPCNHSVSLSVSAGLSPNSKLSPRVTEQSCERLCAVAYLVMAACVLDARYPPVPSRRCKGTLCVQPLLQHKALRWRISKDHSCSPLGFNRRRDVRSVAAYIQDPSCCA